MNMVKLTFYITHCVVTVVVVAVIIIIIIMIITATTAVYYITGCHQLRYLKSVITIIYS
jgi:uncharacterized membrane protein affecting hemolysin expression